MRKPEYKLPITDGQEAKKYTTDVEKYVREWREVAEPICKLTGATIHAFDPDVQIRYGDRKSPQGRTIMGTVITLPLGFLLDLNAKMKKFGIK